MRHNVAGRQLAAAVLLFGGALTGAHGELSDDMAGVTLTVRVFNYERVPRGELGRAQRRAGQVLGTAGVETRWLDCTPDSLGFAEEPECQVAGGPLDLQLKIIPRSQIRRSVLPFIGFGLAQYPERGFAKRASLLYCRAQELADMTGYSVEMILGHVMAHELGHLLLGEGSHGKEGLMQARWDDGDVQLASQGHLGFTAKQAKSLRKAVQDRAGAASRR